MPNEGSARNVAYLDPTDTSSPSVQATTSARADSLASQLRDSLLITEIKYPKQEPATPTAEDLPSLPAND